MGDTLVVGVHSDEEIRLNKGPPVLTQIERYQIIESCKWADEVVPNAPYATQLDWMDKFSCDFCVHGDDVTTTSDGTDCYQLVKDAGRYKECKRTGGVSTTELVGRMLEIANRNALRRSENNLLDVSMDIPVPVSTTTDFLTTSFRIKQFAPGIEPKKGQKVIYVAGSFDLFHLGHIRLLRHLKTQAPENPPFIIAGVWNDTTSTAQEGHQKPIMSLNERCLSVLACKYVDEVVFGSPLVVGEKLLREVFHVDQVVHLPALDGNGKGKYVMMSGQEYEHFLSNSSLNGVTPVTETAEKQSDVEFIDPYRVAKKLGIYLKLEPKDLKSLPVPKELEKEAGKTDPSYIMTTNDIILRIKQNRQVFEERNKRKAKKSAAEDEMLIAEKVAKASKFTEN